MTIEQAKLKLREIYISTKKIAISLTKRETWQKYFLPENKQEHPRMVRFLFLTLFLVLVLIGIGFITSFFILKSGDPKVRVPSVQNQNILHAINAIQSENLSVRVETRYDNNYDIYTVIDQQPKSGIVVREGRMVSLVVSLGRDLYEVPSICGLSRKEGLDILEKANIPYTIQSVKTTNETPQILALNLTPGSKVDRSNSLIVTISENNNPAQFVVENYVDQPVDFVITTLYNNRINPIIITTNVDSIDDDGIIIEQNIPEGEALARNSSIIVTVGLYAQDSGEREKVKWYAINYMIPRAESSGQLEIEIVDDVTNYITPDAPTAKFYKAILSDELGRSRVIYERLGSEGTTFTRVFKAYGRASVIIYADNDIIGERNYGQ